MTVDDRLFMGQTIINALDRAWQEWLILRDHSLADAEEHGRVTSSLTSESQLVWLTLRRVAELTGVDWHPTYEAVDAA